MINRPINSTARLIQNLDCDELTQSAELPAAIDENGAASAYQAIETCQIFASA